MAKARSRPRRKQKAVSRKRTARKAAPRRATKAAAKSRARRRATRAPRPSPSKRRAKRSSGTVTKVAGAVGSVLGRSVDAITQKFRSNENDALELLEKDHRRLEALLNEGEDTAKRGVAGRSEVLAAITSELRIHEELEEKLLYPALKPHAKTTDSVLEGYQEHHVADLLVGELHRLAPDDERWAAKFKVLKENIEHHIEEEEGEMFPAARSVLSLTEREALGTRMQAMKAARR